MAKTMTIEIPEAEAARCNAVIKEVLAKMDLLRKQMRRDQAEIEKSQKRTTAKLEELRAMRK